MENRTPISRTISSIIKESVSPEIGFISRFQWDLPEDVLRIIFLMNTEGEDLADNRRTTLACSRVCRAWRNTSLGFPFLWSRIINFEFDPIPLIKKLLDRSSSAPIDFRRKSRVRALNLTIADDLWKLLLRNKTRWRDVDLDWREEEDEVDEGGMWFWHAYEQFKSKFLLRPAPNVRFLGLDQPRRSILSSPLFAGHAPCLRSLRLKGALPDLEPFITIGANLEDLTVAYKWRQEALSLQQWLRFLENAPNLRFLSLKRPILDSLTRLPATRKVVLNKLELLCLYAPLRVCSSLLDNLSIPSTCGLYIRSESLDPGADESSILKIVSQRVGGWSKMAVKRSLNAQIVPRIRLIFFANLKLNERRNFSSTVESLREGDLASSDPPLVIQPEKYSLTQQKALELFISLFAIFEETFPTTTFLKLWVESHESFDEQSFASLLPGLQQLVNLEALEIFDMSCKLLFPMFRQMPQHSPILFPKLQAIQFFPRIKRLDVSDASTIKSFLQWRREQGYPIPVVDIFESFLESAVDDSQLREEVERAGHIHRH